MQFKRYYHSFRLLFIRTERARADYLRKHRVFREIGENCKWGSRVCPLYPELIILHNNVCVHKNAHLLNHDMINLFLSHYSSKDNFGNLENLGPIEIEDNVYIAMDAIIMPNVKIGKNSIISAGSVVINDIPENSVVSGNPAKIVGRFDSYVAFRKIFASHYPNFTTGHLPNDVIDLAWENFAKLHRK